MDQTARLLAGRGRLIPTSLECALSHSACDDRPIGPRFLPQLNVATPPGPRLRLNHRQCLVELSSRCSNRRVRGCGCPPTCSRARVSRLPPPSLSPLSPPPADCRSASRWSGAWSERNSPTPSRCRIIRRCVSGAMLCVTAMCALSLASVSLGMAVSTTSRWPVTVWIGRTIAPKRRGAGSVGGTASAGIGLAAMVAVGWPGKRVTAGVGTDRDRDGPHARPRLHCDRPRPSLSRRIVDRFRQNVSAHALHCLQRQLEAPT